MDTSRRIVPADAVPSSFVALGDSFTEGIDDPSVAGDGTFRGWADRVAEQFAGRDDRFRYANLAVRGRKIAAIVSEQVPGALDLGPELVSLAGGTNDVLRPRVDLDRMGRMFEDAVRRLRENGSQVLLFQSVDPRPRSRLIASTLPRIKALTTMVEEVAERHQCVLVRLWGAPAFAHPHAWSIDRLHLSSEGHARVAGAVMEAFGLGDHGWSEDLGPYEPESLGERVVGDVRWARHHLAPWLGRRLRRVSSGDGLAPKYPELAPFPTSRPDPIGRT
jgi:lysophospholipase L1-like esterase